MSLLPGTRLGPYEILAPLGAGGMGEVWKAKDSRLDRLVAIKVLPEHLAKHPESLARFEREAKAVAALNHPNITGIFDIGNTDGVAFVAMELLEGESLRTRLDQGPLTPKKATELAIQLAQGLAAAHEKGVVHRDLKPDNLWITKEGRLKILDFGLAKQIQTMGAGSDSFVPTAAIQAEHHTEKGMILGTLGYMSPEQVRGEAVDARADLFSFGVVLFEMLTGKRAFARATASDTMAAILRDDPPELEGQSKPIPLALRRIIDHCLEKAPARRFRDAHDVAFALENLSSPDGSAPLTAPFAPQNLRATRVWAALAAVVILAAILLGWGLRASLGPSSAQSGTPVALRTLTYSGRDSFPAVNPDGRTIAFSSNRDGQARIWVKQLQGGGEVALTTGPGDVHPRYSPDGASILFLRGEGAKSDLYRMSVLGTDLRKVVDDATYADWSPDGTRIAFLRPREDKGSLVSELLAIDPAGGHERTLATIRSESIMASPRWNAEGTAILLVSGLTAAGGQTRRIYRIDVKDGTVREFPTATKYGAVSSAIWLSADEVLYLQAESVTGNGVGTSPAMAYRQNLRTGAVVPLFWAPVAPTTVDLLPGGRVVFDGISGRQSLREYALEGKAPPRWLTKGNISDRQPCFSADGEWVVFSSNRSGNLDLWTVSSRTGVVKSLTDDAAEDWDPSYTPDGKHLLWSSNRSGPFEIWMANPDGSGARQVSQDGADAENPTATPDGQWIVYASGNPKHSGLWKVHPDGSGAKQLVAGAGFTIPDVSPDGQYVVYQSRLNSLHVNIHVRRVEDGSEVPFHTTAEGIRQTVITLGRCRWARDGRHIIFTGQNEQGLDGVYIQDFTPGQDTRATRRALAGFDAEWITESLGLSPDGKRLVLSESERMFSLMIAEGVSGLPSSTKGTK